MIKKKILIIRFSSLGDVILISPVIKKLFVSGYEVDVLTKKKYKEFFKLNPEIKNILLLDDYKSIWSLIKIIRSQQYYRIIDLHRNLRTLIIKLFFLFKTIVYKKYQLRRFFLVRFKLNFLKNNSVIKNYLNSLTKLNIIIKSNDYFYNLKYEIKNISRNIQLLLKKKNLITIAPFSYHFTKEWVYYPSLIQLLGKKNSIVIIGEEKDYQRANTWKGKHVINLCGKLNFNEMIALIDGSKLLVCNDSGIMHLGAGTKTPIISFFGSTVKEFGFTPLRKGVYIIEDKSIRCRPCDLHGKSKCPQKHFLCMRNITVEKVLNYAKHYIKV